MVIAGGVVLGACNVDTTGTPVSLVPHCGDLDGNLTCVAEYPSRPYCNICVPASQSQGCVTKAPAPSCSPDGSTAPVTTGDDDASTSGASVGTTGDETSSTGTPADTTSADTSTTEPALVCRDDGRLDADCDGADPSAPYCVDGGCVGCEAAGGDEFCGALDPAAPACDANTGRCESCDDAPDGFCDGDTPVCGADGACTACTSHDQCPTACHLAPTDPLAGECFPSDQVLWVHASSPCPGLGTEDSPACSLADAVALVPAGESWTIFVEGGTNYAEQIVIEDVSVALRGSANAQIVGQPLLDDASIVATDAFTYIDAIRVRGNAQSHGISAAGGTLWIEDAQVRNNLEYGIFVTEPCDVTLRRASVLRNVGGGIRQFGGTLRLDNASVVGNGDAASGPGINLQFAAFDAVYSTIVNNDGVGADSIQCLESEGALRNSIVAGHSANSIELDCFAFDFVTNAMDTASFVENDSVAIGIYQAGWFVNPSEGDMRLSNPETTAFGMIAQWLAGDAPEDADGTARPMGGALGYVGVDEP